MWIETHCSLKLCPVRTAHRQQKTVAGLRTALCVRLSIELPYCFSCGCRSSCSEDALVQTLSTIPLHFASSYPWYSYNICINRVLLYLFFVPLCSNLWHLLTLYICWYKPQVNIHLYSAVHSIWSNRGSVLTADHQQFWTCHGAGGTYRSVIM